MTRPIPPAIPRLMMAKEVGTILRVSTMTVYRLCDAGELDAVRVGRSVRIPQDSLARYLRKGGSDPGQYKIAP